MEQMLINIGLSILIAAIKNPAHAAEFKTQLLGVADDIYTAYGIVPSSNSTLQQLRTQG